MNRYIYTHYGASTGLNSLFFLIWYVGLNCRLVLKEMKLNVYHGIFQEQCSDNSVLFDYCHPCLLMFWRIGFTRHVGLRCAQRQPTSLTMSQLASKPQSATRSALAPLLLSLIPLMAVAALNVPP